MKYHIASVLILLTLLWMSTVPLVAQDAHSAFPLTVTDGAGRELTFERPPERVVALWNGNFGQLAFLGVRPVATNADDVSLNDDTYFIENGTSIPSVENVGGDVDPELVASFEPDLIIALTVEEAQQMDGIAPVYVNQGLNTQDLAFYKENLRIFGRILDREEEAEAAIIRFENRLQAYKHMVSGEIEPTALISRAWGNQSFFIYTISTAACLLLDEVATCEWRNPAGGTSIYQTSYEGILSLDPDVVLLGHNSGFTNDDIDDLFAELADNPLWNELSAVRNDRVVYVRGYENQSVNSLASAVKFLDIVVPRLYPEVFPDGPPTDEQVLDILSGIEQ